VEGEEDAIAEVERLLRRALALLPSHVPRFSSTNYYYLGLVQLPTTNQV